MWSNILKEAIRYLRISTQNDRQDILVKFFKISLRFRLKYHVTYKPTTPTTKRLSDFSTVIFFPGGKKWSYRFEVFMERKGKLKVLILAKMLLLLLNCFSRVQLCAFPKWQPTRLPSLGFSRQEHWSGCHFLLQCMKVKSESEVAQSCLTLRDPMDCKMTYKYKAHRHNVINLQENSW